MTETFAGVVSRFLEMVAIDGESRNERATARYCSEWLERIGARVTIDGAGERCGADTGNVIAVFEATRAGIPPLMLNSHLDTVVPGRSIRPLIRDGVITSDGTTILGADNRAGLAAILDGMLRIHDEGVAHGRIEILLTVCEEIGLLGAKHCDYGLIEARHGYSLDSSGLGAIITAAPGYEAIDVTVLGHASHSGVNPESGVNAVQICAQALARLPQGKIDERTTINIGSIRGGRARNIVADRCETEIEIRSHDEKTLEKLVRQVETTFDDAIESYLRTHPGSAHPPRVTFVKDREFNGFSIPESHPVVHVSREAIAAIGRTGVVQEKMGGSDANVFNEHGIATVILGTGQSKVHSLEEYVTIRDLEDGSRLVYALIAAWNTCHLKQIT